MVVYVRVFVYDVPETEKSFIKYKSWKLPEDVISSYCNPPTTALICFTYHPPLYLIASLQSSRIYFSSTSVIHVLVAIWGRDWFSYFSAIYLRL